MNQTTHNVYLADTNNHRVDEFSQGGVFLRAFGADVGGAEVDICTTSCSGGVPGPGAGALTEPNFIAIDNSPSGAGDVYVADTAQSVVTKFKADGTLITSWATGGVLDGSTTPGGPFAEIAGITVESSGNLAALTVAPNRLLKFSASGVFLTEFSTPRFNSPQGLTVDGAGAFFQVNGNRTVEKFAMSGGDIGQVTAAGTEAIAVAVDPVLGDLYVNDGGTSIGRFAFNGAGEVVEQLQSPCAVEPGGGPEGLACSPTVSFGSGFLEGAAGLAVDGGTRVIYVVDASAGQIATFTAVSLPDVLTEAASASGATTATVHGAVSAAGGPDTNCSFEYISEAAFQLAGGSFQGATKVACAPAGPFTGSGSEAVSAELSGLSSGTDYRFRVVGTNEKGSNPGAALTFQTLGPVISAEAASSILTTGATISGLINPGGEATSFIVEYVKEASFLANGYAEAVGVPVPAADVGSGSEPVEVTQQLSGLAPGTAYRFRLVAGTAGDIISRGEGGVFSTFALAAGASPDGRSYEMVSPSQKIGEVFPPEPEGSLGGSCSECLPLGGESMSMQASPDGEGLAFVGQPFAAGLAPSADQYIARRSESGWSTHAITPFQEIQNKESGFKALSPDLTRGVIVQGDSVLSPEAPRDADGNSFANLYLWRASSPGLSPLVTEPPPNRPAGRQKDPTDFKVSFASGNSGSPGVPAFEHLVFETNDSLTPAVPDIAPRAPDVNEGRCGGFADTNCDLYEWIEGQLRLINVLPGNETAAAHAVIGSGRRLSDTPSNQGTPEKESVEVDHAISADGSRIFWSDESGQVYVRVAGKETVEIEDPDHGQFLTATPDGSKVLLSDGCLYSLEAEECEMELSGAPSAFLGILGASDDLSRIYFVDTEALAPGARPGSCQGGADAAGRVPAGFGCNVYVYDRGETRFIATLSEEDNNFGTSSEFGAWKASRSGRTAQVTPDGQYLAFMSNARLTGYDSLVVGRPNCRGTTRPTCFEVFEYNLTTDVLSCPSCNSSGQRPLGESNLTLIKPALGGALPQPENLLPDGRLFFQSQDVLTSADTNGRIQDVYKWAPNAVNGCARLGGCVGLISSGRSSNDSAFLNATPDGNNAFVVTREQLLPRDKDDLLDVYDARVGGGIGERQISPCLERLCRGPFSVPPTDGSPGSESFESAPAPKRCRKGVVRKHGKCVKRRARHRHHKRRHRHVQGRRPGRHHIGGEK